MKLACAILLVCLAAAPCVAARSAWELPAALMAEVEAAQFAGKTVDQIAGRVAGLAGLRASVESVDVPKAALVRPMLGVDKQSLASVLDTAVAQDGRYTWTCANGWIHLTPRERPADYLLDRVFPGPIPSIVGVGTALRDVAAGLDVGQWQIILISAGPCLTCGGEPVPGVNEPPHGCSVRDVIDFVVARGGGHAWFIKPWQDDEGSVKGTSLIVSL